MSKQLILLLFTTLLFYPGVPGKANKTSKIFYNKTIERLDSLKYILESDQQLLRIGIGVMQEQQNIIKIQNQLHENQLERKTTKF